MSHHNVSHEPDDDTLILSVSLHTMVGVVCDSEYVRWLVTNLLVSVLIDLVGCVYG